MLAFRQPSSRISSGYEYDNAGGPSYTKHKRADKAARLPEHLQPPQKNIWGSFRGSFFALSVRLASCVWDELNMHLLSRWTLPAARRIETFLSVI